MISGRSDWTDRNRTDRNRTDRNQIDWNWTDQTGPDRGRGGSRNVQEGPYMPGERFWNRGINLKKCQKIDILKNQYNSSFAWSYGSGVGTVKIPVKNCIDSWGQILKNRCFGPVTSK